MSWQGIVGHDEIVEWFRHALRQGRLASSFLFCGPPGVGKRAFALKLAQALLCQRKAAELLDPCGECPACVQAAAGSHPDLDVVAKPSEKSFLPLELLIGDKEHRMREGLCYRLSLQPVMGGRRIAVIDDADYLNQEGANCLLKTLEEPPPRSILILIGTSPARQLPTIRSRCQIVRFAPLPVDAVAELLVSRGLVADEALARRAAEASDGSLQKAMEQSDPDLWSFRDQLFQNLAAPVLASVPLARAVQSFVDEAGKEAPRRRQRLRQIIAQAIEFYRAMLRASDDTAAGGDESLRRWIVVRAERNAEDEERLVRQLEACLEALELVDRNANQTTLIEAWLDQLAKLGSLAGRPA